MFVEREDRHVEDRTTDVSGTKVRSR
jgi:hypothetical protein